MVIREVRRFREGVLNEFFVKVYMIGSWMEYAGVRSVGVC